MSDDSGEEILADPLELGSPTSIFAQTSYESAEEEEEKPKYEGWHKPRKQYVRRTQWAEEISWLLTNRVGGSGALNYCGLPGSDLLDIRYIYRRFCDSTALLLRFLGFDESASPASPRSKRESLSVSLQEIRQLENVIAEQTTVIPDDLRLLADEDSVAWDRARTYGPFDVVNIDLCDHVGGDHPSIDTSLYNAIARLLSLQAQPGRVWSLFLTTRLGILGFDDDAWKKISSALDRNIDACEGFEAELRGAFASVPASLDSRIGWTEREFFDIGATAIAKWLMVLVRSQGGTLRLSSSYSYKVHHSATHQDMISLAFRIEYPYRVPSDSTGLVTLQPTSGDDCDDAKMVPGIIAQTIDADHQLEVDFEESRVCLDEAEELMVEARYDGEDFRRWAQEYGFGPTVVETTSGTESIPNRAPA